MEVGNAAKNKQSQLKLFDILQLFLSPDGEHALKLDRLRFKKKSS